MANPTPNPRRRSRSRRNPAPKQQQQQRKTNPAPRRRRMGNRARPSRQAPPCSYTDVVMNPFTAQLCKVPTFDGAATGLTTTPMTVSGITATLSTAQTSYDWMITMSPFLQTTALSIYVWDRATTAWVSAYSTSLPNLAAITGSTTASWNQIAARICSMGARFTNDNPEMYSGGRVWVLQHSINGNSTSTVPALFGPLGTTTSGTIGRIPAAVVDAASIRHQGRLMDGTLTAHYVPTCQTLVDANSNSTVITPIAPGVFVVDTYQTLTIMGINTPSPTGTASATFALPSMEFVWNYEVDPFSPESVTYPLTPTIADPIELARAVNISSRAAQSGWSSELMTGGSPTAGGVNVSRDSGSRRPLYDSVSGFVNQAYDHVRRNYGTYQGIANAVSGAARYRNRMRGRGQQAIMG